MSIKEQDIKDIINKLNQLNPETGEPEGPEAVEEVSFHCPRGFVEMVFHCGWEARECREDADDAFNEWIEKMTEAGLLDVRIEQ